MYGFLDIGIKIIPECVCVFYLYIYIYVCEKVMNKCFAIITRKCHANPKIGGTMFREHTQKTYL